jgi:hypothetical protein
MATPHRSSTLPRDVGDLLEQIAQHGTPFRIDSVTATYYVLSAEQLLTLLRGTLEAVASVESFTPQDFGLTETDMAGYEARRQVRRAQSDPSMLAPLEVTLAQRLRYWHQVRHPQPLSEQEKREIEHLLQELETAMGANVQAVVQKTT